MRRRQTFGWCLATVGLLFLVWELSRGINSIITVLTLTVSAVSVVAAAGTIVAEQSRKAVRCFGLMLLGVIVLILSAGMWSMAIVMTILSVAAFAIDKFVPAQRAQSWHVISRETDSWEPMLAAVTAAVMVGTLALPISRNFGNASPMVHNMVITGVLLVGIGLMGLISRISTPRMFLAMGVMLAGTTMTAIGWNGPLDGLISPIVIVVGLVGCMWTAAAILLMRHTSDSHESPADQSVDRMNTRLYALLTVIAFVVLAGFLRIGV
ncbi:MAG: hypothetical protein JXM70_29865 [Pirellulales bacterium]|nr:hypothetical protein [Pirellulales bacterium]